MHTMFLDCLLLCVLVLESVSNARGITRGFHREFSNGMEWNDSALRGTCDEMNIIYLGVFCNDYA